MPDEKKQKLNWLWPKIVDLESAKKAAILGYWAAIIVAVVTGVIATIALVEQKKILTLDPWSYVDAALFGFIAWRIKKYSRVFSAVGIFLFVVEKALLASSHGSAGWPIVVLLLLMFINGARGVFAYHRFSDELPNVPKTSQNL